MVNIRGKIVTADALHGTKDFAEYLVSRQADYVFVMKGNRKKLIDRLEMLDIKDESYSKVKIMDFGHGRKETRTLYRSASANATKPERYQRTLSMMIWRSKERMVFAI
ncbi:MAG TPA: hypothetical protein VE954_38125 [Oligoflexus sp.]|uniref:hypothetical protein n=1 Tax=Oligoflexus sp. TaxID=1971216 RepID=UPI002D6FFC11|nr:hypothetical protein [Oligoflexus sp.]HYX38957.1 hypothetical protein [Oligoflexus sp.]